MLSGAPVLCTDLRAAAALVLAGLAAQGKTVIHGLHHLDRGYDQLDVKLQNLGAKIRRLTSTGRDQEFMSNVNTTPAKITRK